ncbi:hypothetical protein [Streptomyces sp. NPDC047130]|uniref:hypothetical protein n=1 Tax=Streptomyces sp. NPDC047130 TaxID=3155261 RepID=UPI0033DEAF12
MSWDVLLIRLPHGTTSLTELPPGGPPPLGRRDELHARIRGAFPDVNLTDPSWGELGGDGWSMELNMGDKDQVDTLMLHLRGGGDDAVSAVLRLAGALDCHAYDTSTDDLIRPDGPNGWRAFQAYRDGIRGVPGASAADTGRLPG